MSSPAAHGPKYHDLPVTFRDAARGRSGQATVHYIEAGDSTRPTILLLHGFPSSSYQFRDLIPLLSAQYHLLAPDLPGFGLTQVSEDEFEFEFTFANLAAVVGAWLAALQISNVAAMYIFDYGAPVGLRLVTAGALQVAAIITQNGNAYQEGFGQAFWAPIFALWRSENAPAVRQVLVDNVLTLGTTRYQYVEGTPQQDLPLLNPEAWTFNYLQNIAGDRNIKHQLDLFWDYRTNVDLYPQFQRYFVNSGVKILAIWGKGDPAFIPAGAEAFKSDAPNAVIKFVDAGHFALETARWEIAQAMKDFLGDIGI